MSTTEKGKIGQDGMVQTNAGIDTADRSYEAALTALDGLITGTKRGAGDKWIHPFEGMQTFLEVHMQDAQSKFVQAVHLFPPRLLFCIDSCSDCQCNK